MPKNLEKKINNNKTIIFFGSLLRTKPKRNNVANKKSNAISLEGG